MLIGGRYSSRPAGFRGLGDAAADYAAIASQYDPTSAMYAFWMGLARNPDAAQSANVAAQIRSNLQTQPQSISVFQTAQGPASVAGGFAPASATILRNVGPNQPGQDATARIAAGLLPAGTPPAGSPSPAPPTVAPSFTLSNVSRPGQNFQVGDKWSLVVTGPPGQPVTMRATQNGQDKGTSNLGATDGNGNFQIGNTMTPDVIGNWTETYSVGGVPIGTVNFIVLQSPGPSGTQSTTPPSSTSPSTGMSTQPPGGQPSPAPVTAPSNALQIGGLQIPMWAVGASAFGLILLLGKGLKI